MEFNFKCKYKKIIRFSRRIWLFDIVVFFVFLTKNNINVFNKRFIRGRQRLTCRRIDKYFHRLVY